MTSSHRPIYLDYASTTPMHPAVLRQMEPYVREEFGNPSNLHPLGRRAAQALERARAQVSGVLGCHDEVAREDRGPNALRNHLSSETGLVYTLLGHAACRLG